MKAIREPGGQHSKSSTAKAWLNAIAMTAPIATQPKCILPTVIDDRALVFADSPALLSESECLTYRELAQQSNRYARWAMAYGVGKGESVGLLMPNRPEYLAAWLGITKCGGVVALLNTSVSGPSLAHCINIAQPKHLIVAAELLDGLESVLAVLGTAATIWVHGPSHGSCRRMDLELLQFSGEPLNDTEGRPVTIDDPALYIYTSGTTGLPKAATLSHGRLMQWSHWFAGMMGTQPSDRMYTCLPMYHSVGGVQAPGALLVSGGSVVLSEKFSARRFWNDVVRWDCTMFQYIGELCRYLLHTEPSPIELEHHLRLVCGNGLRGDIWNEFKDRFRIPRILEFYAATEGNVSLFNLEDEPGAIGRIPPYLAHRFPATLVKFDVETGEPIRDEHGFCVRCAPNQVGEAIGELLTNSTNIGSRFEGYTNKEATENKILHNVFQPGDAWFRTGDLMRKDERGFFYFVDRIGDTFRWKGENVATSEVSVVLSEFPGIKEANVYGVTIPGCDGRAGMATLVADAHLDLKALRKHLISRLPSYACPLFLRIRTALDVTATFKYTKTHLVQEGFDPSAIADPIFFNDSEQEAFIPVDNALYQRIQTGQVSSSTRRRDRLDRTGHTSALPPENFIQGRNDIGIEVKDV